MITQEAMQAVVERAKDLKEAKQAYDVARKFVMAQYARGRGQAEPGELVATVSTQWRQHITMKIVRRILGEDAASVLDASVGRKGVHMLTVRKAKVPKPKKPKPEETSP